MPRWFKGMMEIIIHDWGLWPQKGLNAQCEGFKCVKGRSDCCFCWLLFIQPDFENQKSHLEEFITSRGHICDFKFYLKYQCITASSNLLSSTGEQQSWSTRLSGPAWRWRTWKKHQELTWWCANCPNPMLSFFSLDFSSWLIINLISYSNCAAQFISAYYQGLSGPDSRGCVGKLEISWPPRV